MLNGHRDEHSLGRAVSVDGSKAAVGRHERHAESSDGSQHGVSRVCADVAVGDKGEEGRPGEK